MISLLASLALAAPTFTDLGFVLTPPASGAFAGGINAPTVAWDGTRYVAYFEAPVPAADVPSDCINSYVIGRATSADGLVWTIDETPVLGPDRGDATSVYSCSVSQPAVVFDGATWHLLFAMGDQKLDADAVANLAAGIGYATSTDGVSFTVQQAPSGLGDFDDATDWHAPEEGGSHTLTVSMPTATLVDRTLQVVYLSRKVEDSVVKFPMHVAKLDLDTGAWSLRDDDFSPAFTGTDWAPYGLFSPAVYCDAENERIGLVVGGYTEATYVGRTIGLASTEDLVTWDVGGGFIEPLFGSVNHIEVLPAGDDLLVFYSATDPASGLKAVGLAATSSTWSTPEGRACSWADEPVDTGDTGDTGGDTGDTAIDTGDTAVDTATDTGDTGTIDTSTPSDTADTGEDDKSGGCNCDTTTGPTGAVGGMFAALGALAFVRRRRA